MYAELRSAAEIRWGFPMFFNKEAIDVSQRAVNCISRIFVDVVGFIRGELGQISDTINTAKMCYT